MSLVALTIVVAFTSPTARASQPYEHDNEDFTVLVISKSSNRNEVHYSAHLDASCAPETRAPLHAYWLMRERGPQVTEPFSSSEQRVLGIASQEVSGDTIRFVVKGLPSRTFVVHPTRGADGTCSARVDTVVAGARAQLTSVYVKQRWLGVDYVQLTGLTPEGKLVQERLSP